MVATAELVVQQSSEVDTAPLGHCPAARCSSAADVSLAGTSSGHLSGGCCGRDSARPCHLSLPSPTGVAKLVLADRRSEDSPGD